MSKKRYLQQLGQSWYVRVKVPAELQQQLRNTHIRRALGTSDLDEADRRKWPAVMSIRAEFDRLRGLPPCGNPRYASSRQPPGELAPSCRIPAAPPVQSIANPGLGLDELLENWLATNDFLKTTNFQRRKAYEGFRHFVGANLSPSSVTGALAASYVDERLMTGPEAPSTKRHTVSGLAVFWEWLQQRQHVPRGHNPWRGFRVSSKRQDSHPPKKRPYTDEELLVLFSGEPCYRGMRDVMALGLLTGARIDEICSLKVAETRWVEGIALVRISRSKTEAGCRTLAISHPVALDVLRRRWHENAPPSALLFSELQGGGYDNKLSWGLGQAFRRHRDLRGLSRETDFHSLRRTFITRLENLGVDQVRIARYVGHQIPTLAFKVYSGGSTDNTQRETAKAIRYPPTVEAALATFVAADLKASNNSPGGDGTRAGSGPAADSGE